MRGEVGARGVRVAANLVRKLLKRGEFDFATHIREELQPRLTAIEIAGVIQKVTLHIDAVITTDRRANADIRHGDMTRPILDRKSVV